MEKSSKSELCIVTSRNIFDAPCLAKYCSLIDEPFDIIYWDKCGFPEDCGAENYFRHEGIVATNASKKQKILKYYGFFKYVNRILRQNDYKKLIIFPTQVSWLILGKLKGRYKNRYLLDIRDYAGENKFIIRKLTAKAVKNARLCSITSDAYKAFLPKGIDYLVSHNVQEIDKGLVELYRNRTKKNVSSGDRIVLSFIGTVRFIDNLKELIKRFSGDNRFLLRFIGRGSDELKSFVEERSEKLLKETCGDFTCKYENWEEDKAHNAEEVLLKEDLEQAEVELQILEKLLPKFRKFVKEKRAELEKEKVKLAWQAVTTVK